MSTAFLTDFYELTMIQASLESGKADTPAVFELFARKLPAGRGYGVVAGVDRAMKAVQQFRFTDEQIDFLIKDGRLNSDTISFLKNYRFRGDIYAYRDGDVFFPYSPIVTVVGTFADAVILETLLLSILNHDSAVAGAASRMVQAANGIPIIEMGSRRTHELAAVDSARIAYICGFKATSNVEAGQRFGIPVVGTSAHAFTLAHNNEIDAFRSQVRALGVDTTLLVDTYDIEEGINNAVRAAQEAGAPGPGGIRIDSGSLGFEVTKARKQLDALGDLDTKIVVSSDIDEFSIEEMVSQNVPVDSFGAGTRVVTGSGHPTAGMVFKLVQRTDPDGVVHQVAKKSSGKKSVGGFKYAYRAFEDGVITDEFYTFEKDNSQIPVQVKFIEAGKQIVVFSTEETRAFHALTMNRLPEALRGVNVADTFEVSEGSR